jgi:hypothetical protein
VIAPQHLSQSQGLDRPKSSDTFSDHPTSATAIALLGQQQCDRNDDKDIVARLTGRGWLIAIAKPSIESGDSFPVLTQRKGILANGKELKIIGVFEKLLG